MLEHRFGCVCACILAVSVLGSFFRPVIEKSPKAEPFNGRATDTPMLAAQRSAFIPNSGQWTSHVRFMAGFGRMQVAFETAGWMLHLRAVGAAPHGQTPPSSPSGATLRMTFVGAAPTQVVGEDRLPGVHNYFLGSDPRQWHTSVPRFGAVAYYGLYPGVDLRGYEKSGQFEYDVILAEGVSPCCIEVRVEGAEQLCIEADGAMVFTTAAGQVRQPPPVAYAVDRSRRQRPVGCAYRLLSDDRFGFMVADAVIDGTLVIDPGLLFGTYLGGYSEERVDAVCVDDAGRITVAGASESASFPTTPGAWRRQWVPGFDAVISCFDTSRFGTEQLVYSTFLGGWNGNYCGSQWDQVLAMSQDDDGVLTLVGYTSSCDFPTTADAWDRRFHGAGPYDGDAFVMRFDPSRQGAGQILYSTFLGGRGQDFARALHVDESGVITLVGDTGSNDYPTSLDAFDRSYASGDAFVTRLDTRRPPREQLVYSTFLGGKEGELAYAVAVGPGGVIALTGSTTSVDFPTTKGALSRSHGNWHDAFVAQLDPSRSGSQQLLYSTYFGGQGLDLGWGLSTDATGALTVVGMTQSPDLPITASAIKRTVGDQSSGFIARLDPKRSGIEQLLYGSFFGGLSYDSIRTVSVASSGLLTIGGFAFSSDFPTTRGAAGRLVRSGDAFVARLDLNAPPAEQLLYCTVLGGSEREVIAASVPGPRNTVVLAGSTNSSDFPSTPGAWDNTYNGGTLDFFVAQLDMLPIGVERFGASSPGCSGELSADVNSMPFLGNLSFRLTCDNAPASARGELLLASRALTTPFRVAGVDLWLDPQSEWLLIVPAQSSATGYAAVPFPIPNDASLIGGSAHAQFCWFGMTRPPRCPPLGFSTSDGLRLTIQR